VVVRGHQRSTRRHWPQVPSRLTELRWGWTPKDKPLIVTPVSPGWDDTALAEFMESASPEASNDLLSENLPEEL
jgi:hypothetical protein